VRRRRHGEQVAGGVEAGLGERGGDVREALHLDLPHVEPDRGLAGALELGVDGERHLVARRQLVHEALALRVVEQGSLAAYGLGDQKAVARPVQAERGGVELHELEIGEQRTRLAHKTEAGADRAARVRGALPQRRHPAGGEDHGPRRQRAEPAVAAPYGEAGAALVARGERGRGHGLEHADALVGGGERGEGARDPAPGGRAARVHDAPLRVATLQPEGEVAGAVGVELDALELKVAHPRRRLVA
jgi:hypothetical protein